MDEEKIKELLEGLREITAFIMVVKAASPAPVLFSRLPGTLLYDKSPGKI